MAWVWDRLIALRLVDTPGSGTSRTTRGFWSVGKPKADGGGGLIYRGTFDQGQAGGYHVNDIVRVRSGGSQGVFICILDNPISTDTGLCIAPAYPENTYWDMWAFGVKEVNICNNGDGHLYIQSSDVF